MRIIVKNVREEIKIEQQI